MASAGIVNLSYKSCLEMAVQNRIVPPYLLNPAKQILVRI